MYVSDDIMDQCAAGCALYDMSAGRPHLEESETMMVAAAREAATMRKLSGIIAEPSLKTKRVPKRCSAGMMRLKVASISSFGRWLNTTTTLGSPLRYARQT